jgi:hypothetical protein
MVIARRRKFVERWSFSGQTQARALGNVSNM